ncbi:MAG: RidA family protein [Ignavibacteria bacterium]|nr:RidA family protein [Ignavibacteria bacterium]
MSRQTVATSRAPGAIGPYSQGVSASGTFLFTAGQIALDPATGKLVEGSVEDQTKRVLENLKAILEQGGSGLSHVVKTTVFLKDMGDFAAMNGVYSEYFKQDPPARSTVQVSRLPMDVRVEIEAVALVVR